MEPDGTYVRKQPGKARHSAQEELLEALARENGG
jgi:hypothetical protein